VAVLKAFGDHPGYGPLTRSRRTVNGDDERTRR
jgi:hypothetical protein